MRLAGNLARDGFEHAPDVFGENFLPGRVWMNTIVQIQRGVACHSLQEIRNERRVVRGRQVAEGLLDRLLEAEAI